MHIKEVAKGKLKTLLKVNGNLNTILTRSEKFPFLTSRNTVIIITYIRR